LSNSEIEESSFIIFPNPVKDVINIESNKSILINRVELFSIEGTKVQCSYFNSDKVKVDVKDLISGIYLISITILDGKTINSKVFIY